jgi:hypothetical protein
MEREREREISIAVLKTLNMWGIEEGGLFACICSQAWTGLQRFLFVSTALTVLNKVDKQLKDNFLKE